MPSSYYNDNNNYSYWDYFSIPLHLFIFILIVLFMLVFSWYINYESRFEDMMTLAKFFLILLPLLLIILFHCLPLPEKDSLHRAGATPWGVAFVLVFLLFMISHQSSFHERWFPFVAR
ncbi:hypothetical protein L484_016712 [Morus notabilis]|uniref:Transmembrane protein n=1 Tax=Morus notabilis TaxID=981085 RepID=W9S3N2_9ROSA|nr:uncharacterized protein LOC21399750 [Morus notabilis]EXB87366.1 hypothetical protein L484_016712 [Morus notabilis]